MYICIYLRHSQLRTPRSWLQIRICSYFLSPVVGLYIFITFWILDSDCFQFFIALVAVTSVTDWDRSVHHFFRSPSKSTGMLGKWRQLPEKRAWCVGKRHWGLKKSSIVQLVDALAYYTEYYNGSWGQWGQRTIARRQSTIKVPCY